MGAAPSSQEFSAASTSCHPALHLLSQQTNEQARRTYLGRLAESRRCVRVPSAPRLRAFHRDCGSMWRLCTVWMNGEENASRREAVRLLSSRATPDRTHAAVAAEAAQGSADVSCAIAEQLNAEGHRNRAGREWSPQIVHHVLQGRLMSLDAFSNGQAHLGVFMPGSGYPQGRCSAPPLRPVAFVRPAP